MLCTLDWEIKLFHFWLSLSETLKVDGHCLSESPPSANTVVIIQYLRKISTLRERGAYVFLPPTFSLTPTATHAQCPSSTPLRSLTPFPGQVVLSWVIISVSTWFTLIVTQKSGTASFLMVRFSEWLLDVFLSFRCRVSFCAALGVFPLLKFWLWMVTMIANESPLFNIPRGRRGSVTSATGVYVESDTCPPTPTSLFFFFFFWSFRAGSAE